MAIHRGTSGIHGSYTRDDRSTTYKYYGKYTSDYPAHWEAKVWRSTDVIKDVRIDARAELSGPLLNGIGIDAALLRALVKSQIEYRIEETSNI